MTIAVMESAAAKDGGIQLLDAMAVSVVRISTRACLQPLLLLLKKNSLLRQLCLTVRHLSFPLDSGVLVTTPTPSLSTLLDLIPNSSLSPTPSTTGVISLTYLESSSLLSSALTLRSPTT